MSVKSKKKKRHNRLTRSSNSTNVLEKSEDTGSAEVSSDQSIGRESSRARNMESSYGDFIDDPSFPTETPGSNPPPSLATITPVTPRVTGWRLEQGGPGLTALSRNGFVHDVSGNLTDSEDSPAVKSLRRISRSMTQTSDSKRREFKHLSRTLTDKINTIFRPKGMISSKPFANENRDSRNIFAYRKKSSGLNALDKMAPKDLSPAPKEANTHAAGPSTPATITLRKASDAYLLSAATNADSPTRSDKAVIKENPLPLILTATSNLVAFHTTRKYDAAPSPSRGEAPLAGRPASPTSMSTESENFGSRARSMSIIQLSNPGVSQQYTPLADAALTVTSFYPVRDAPVKPPSPSNSVSIERAACRFSVVQFVSRNSVHEVIWYEDETSTSGTSASPISPANLSQSSNKSLSPDGMQVAPKVSVTTASAGVSAPPPVFDSVPKDQRLDPTIAQKRLLSWSWDNQQPSVDDYASTSAGSLECAELRSNKSTQSMRRAATADISTTEYFPHVDTHGSTSSDEQAESPTGSAELLVPKTRTRSKEDRDVQEAYDRGLAMFRQRGKSLGSVRTSPMTAPSMGDKYRVKSSGSQLEVDQNAG